MGRTLTLIAFCFLFFSAGAQTIDDLLELPKDSLVERARRMLQAQGLIVDEELFNRVTIWSYPEIAKEVAGHNFHQKKKLTAEFVQHVQYVSRERRGHGFEVNLMDSSFHLIGPAGRGRGRPLMIPTRKEKAAINFVVKHIKNDEELKRAFEESKPAGYVTIADRDSIYSIWIRPYREKEYEIQMKKRSGRILDVKEERFTFERNSEPDRRHALFYKIRNK